MEESLEYKYVIHTILVVNDLARDSVLNLIPYMENKDKETKKIFGALLKRVNIYDKNIKKVLGKEHGFRSIYNSFMDDEVDVYKDGFINRVKEIYYQGDVEDYEFLSEMEYSSLCVQVAARVWETMYHTLRSKGLHSHWLIDYKLDELCKISQNLARWCYRNEMKKENAVTLEGDQILMYNLNAMFEVITSRAVFEKCFEQANEEKKRSYELYLH